LPKTLKKVIKKFGAFTKHYTFIKPISDDKVKSRKPSAQAFYAPPSLFFIGLSIQIYNKPKPFKK